MVTEDTDSSKVRRRLAPLPALVVVSALGCAVALAWQAANSGPTGDEAAHLASGLATVRTGDFGYYRVNPPLHRLVSGLPVDWAYHPKIGELYPASATASGFRFEFAIGNQLLKDNRRTYHRSFVLGRLVRIPFVLLGGALLVWSVCRIDSTAGLLAAILWFSSPLVLGHGWGILPDAFSGVAMAAIIAATIHWLAHRNGNSLILAGIAWGAAISIKFTFCPIYALWPAVLVAYCAANGRLFSREPLRLVGGHVAQGFVALAVVIVSYGASDVGVPLGDHGFQSKTFGWIGNDDSVTSKWLGRVPSPFPMQFLVGIDEQQLDLEGGTPTYVLGRWYDDGIWWYYLPGTLIKEQLAFWLGLLTLPWGAWLIWRGRGVAASESDAPEEGQVPKWPLLVALLTGAALIYLILCSHGKLALNVRYIFPALPLLYLAIALGWSLILARLPGWGRAAFIGLLAVTAVAEMSLAFPYHYSYANPLVGGQYRVPPALHDSNFDAGQDLWHLERWIMERVDRGEQEPFVCLPMRVPEECLRFRLRVPDEELLREFVEQRGSESEGDQARGPVVVSFRSLGVPAPWDVMRGGTDEAREALKELLQHAPDEFITPTLAVYRLRQNARSLAAAEDN